MTSAMKRHYGPGAIAASLKHFMVGKGMKVLSSLVVLILLARLLPREQYAVYISFQAIVMFGGLLASAGIETVLLRYIPELRSTGQDRIAYRFLAIGVLVRVAVLLVPIAIVLALKPALGEWLNMQEWMWLLPVYLLVGLIRLTSLTLSQAMESLLWQREAQYSLAAGNIARMLALVTASFLVTVDLRMAIAIELGAEVLIFVLLSAGAWLRYRNDADRGNGESGWWEQNRKRVVKFGAWSWMVSLGGMFYGSGAFRLLAARFLPASELATFGFADSFTNLARRLMPVRLLLGLIRPVFMSRYSVHGEFSKLTDLSNLVFRVNLVLFAVPVALLIVVGPQVVSWVTAGKYPDAAWLIAGFLIVLCVEGLRILMELLAQAVERNQITLVSNLVQSAMLISALFLFPILGVWALIVAAFAGSSLSVVVSIFLLRHRGHHFAIEPANNLLVIAYTIAATAAGYGASRVFGDSAIGNVWVPGVITLGVFALAMWIRLPFDLKDRATIEKLITNLKSKKSSTVVGEVSEA